MHKVTDQKTFEKAVLAMTKQKNAKLFHCYVAGDIFKIATAERVQEFDFSEFEDVKAVDSEDDCYFEERIIVPTHYL